MRLLVRLSVACSPRRVELYSKHRKMSPGFTEGGNEMEDGGLVCVHVYTASLEGFILNRGSCTLILHITTAHPTQVSLSR